MQVRVIAPKTAAAAGWWVVAGKTCVAAYQPKGAASYAASLVNLATPGTLNAYEGVAPAWDTAVGWTFNGTSQYLYIPNINPFPNDQSWSVLIQATLGVGGSGYASPCGMYTYFGPGDSATFGWQTGSTRAFFYYSYSGGQYGTNSGTSGNLGIAGNKAYLNGTYKGDIPAAGSGAHSGNMAIGARRTAVAARDAYFPGIVAAFALYSDTLTAGEVATLSAAMAAL